MLNYLLRFIPFLIYIAPFLMIAYWFWVGMKYSRIVKKPVIAISLANCIVYDWRESSGRCKECISNIRI